MIVLSWAICYLVRFYNVLHILLFYILGTVILMAIGLGVILSVNKFCLTHVLTHNRKRADGDNGVKMPEMQIHPSEKRYKCPNSTESTP